MTRDSLFQHIFHVPCMPDPGLILDYPQIITASGLNHLTQVRRPLVFRTFGSSIQPVYLYMGKQQNKAGR